MPSSSSSDVCPWRGDFFPAGPSRMETSEVRPAPCKSQNHDSCVQTKRSRPKPAAATHGAQRHRVQGRAGFQALLALKMCIGLPSCAFLENPDYSFRDMRTLFQGYAQKSWPAPSKTGVVTL